MPATTKETEQDPSTKRGPYKSGLERKKQILEEARQLIIEEGYPSFSIRKVAKRVGLSAGNVQYHFPTREQFVAELLEYIIADYFLEFERLALSSKSPKEHLFYIIQHVTRDLTKESTTKIFPELWSLANHVPEYDQFLENIYRRYRQFYHQLAQAINPELTDHQAYNFALFISASIEGHTVFIGHNKSHTAACEDVIHMVYSTAMHLLESGDIPG